jgi:ribosomal protein S18 acetylase RimI-like enzyme
MSHASAAAAAASGPVRIVPATDMDVVRVLFREYVDSLGLDLSFQGFDAELAGLPGRYAPPGGCLFVAEAAGTAVGCVALRALDGPGVCEMKRLFVRPGRTGQGLGRRLAETVIAAARRLGYATMRLDTLTSMAAANVLYRRLGFARIAPYCPNPLDGARFYELPLHGPGPLDTTGPKG